LQNWEELIGKLFYYDSIIVFNTKGRVLSYYGFVYKKEKEKEKCLTN